MSLEFRFCQTSEGERVAFAAIGHGPALVMTPGWVTQTQIHWSWPGYQRFWSTLARHRTVVQYDRLGCGLSERSRTDFTIDADLRALSAIVDHLEFSTFALIGVSGGGPSAIVYAARHPQRVSHLILYGTGARTLPEELPVRAALRDLVRASWGEASDVLAGRHIPGEDYEAQLRHAQYQREAADVDVAIGLHELADRTDVTAEARQIRVPTLVLHRRGDRAVPFARSQELAALIPDAAFLPLDGHLHPPQQGDADTILDAMMRFLGDTPGFRAGRDSASGPTPMLPHPPGLSVREMDVLALLSNGLTNKEIAGRLGLQVSTIERHLVNLYRKLDVRSRTEAAAYAHRHGMTASAGHM